MAKPYQVIISPRAEASLERIINYLVATYSLDTADKIRAEIMDAIFSLENRPSKNPLAKGIISKNNITYRRVMSKLYRIIYSINEDKLQVLVVDIHHSKQGNPNIYKGFE